MRAVISVGFISMVYSFSAYAQALNYISQTISCFAFYPGDAESFKQPVVEITPGGMNATCQSKENVEYCVQYTALPEGAVPGALGFVSINAEFKKPLSLHSGSVFILPSIASFQKIPADEGSYLAGKEIQNIGNSYIRLENKPALNIQCFSIQNNNK